MKKGNENNNTKKSFCIISERLLSKIKEKSKKEEEKKSREKFISNKSLNTINSNSNISLPRIKEQSTKINFYKSGKAFNKRLISILSVEKKLNYIENYYSLLKRNLKNQSKLLLFDMRYENFKLLEK